MIHLVNLSDEVKRVSLRVSRRFGGPKTSGRAKVFSPGHIKPVEARVQACFNGFRIDGLKVDLWSLVVISG